jgi:hypothetical protein
MVEESDELKPLGAGPYHDDEQTPIPGVKINPSLRSD